MASRINSFILCGKFRFFFGHLLDVTCEDIILDGDFNFVLDVTVDKKGNDSTRGKSLEILREFVTQLDLIDAWRVLNPDGSLYTWSRRKKPEISCP